MVSQLDQQINFKLKLIASGENELTKLSADTQRFSIELQKVSQKINALSQKSKLGNLTKEQFANLQKLREVYSTQSNVINQEKQRENLLKKQINLRNVELQKIRQQISELALIKKNSGKGGFTDQEANEMSRLQDQLVATRGLQVQDKERLVTLAEQNKVRAESLNKISQEIALLQKSQGLQGLTATETKKLEQLKRRSVELRNIINNNKEIMITKREELALDKQSVKLQQRKSMALKEFKMEYLGILFAGMALQRFTVGFLRNAINTFNKQSDKVNEFTAQTNKLTAAWTFFQYRLISALSQSPLFQNFIDFVVGLVDRLSGLSDKNILKIVSAFVTLAAIGTFFLVGGQFFLGLDNILKIFNKWSGSLLKATKNLGAFVMLHPYITLMVIAIALMAAAILSFPEIRKSVGESFNRLAETTKKTFNQILDTIGISVDLSDTWKVLAEAGRLMFDYLVLGLQFLMAGISTVLAGVQAVIVGIKHGVSDLLTFILDKSIKMSKALEGIGIVPIGTSMALESMKEALTPENTFAEDIAKVGENLAEAVDIEGINAQMRQITADWESINALIEKNKQNQEGTTKSTEDYLSKLAEVSPEFAAIQSIQKTISDDTLWMSTAYGKSSDSIVKLKNNAEEMGKSFAKDVTPVLSANKDLISGTGTDDGLINAYLSLAEESSNIAKNTNPELISSNEDLFSSLDTEYEKVDRLADVYERLNRAKSGISNAIGFSSSGVSSARTQSP